MSQRTIASVLNGLIFGLLIGATAGLLTLAPQFVIAEEENGVAGGAAGGGSDDATELVVDVTVLPNPEEIDDADGEWILFENTGEGDLAWDGWTIEDDASFSYSFSGTLFDGDEYRICANSSTTLNGGFDCDDQWSGGAVLNNTGDTLTVRDTADKEVWSTSWGDVSDGELVEDSFTIVTKKFGAITIKKESPDEELIDASFDFESDILDFSLIVDGQAGFGDVEVGEYVFTEVATSGAQVSDITCDEGVEFTADIDDQTLTVTVEANKAITCTFTNEFVEQIEGESITIEKVGDSALDGEVFSFAGDLGTFELVAGGTSTTFDAIATGTYRVRELVADNTELESLVCTGDTDEGSVIFFEAGGVSIDLDTGEHITCTFANVDTSIVQGPFTDIDFPSGSISISKNAEPASSTEFFFTGDLGEFSFVDDDPDADPVFVLTEEPVGEYTITELPTAGWVLSAIDCGDDPVIVNLASSSVTFTLEKDASISCDFRNVATTTDDINTDDTQNNNTNDDGGGISGGGRGDRINTDDEEKAEGLVLGESIGTHEGQVAGDTCVLVNDHLKQGRANSVDEIVHLQLLLNKLNNAGILITGTFDVATRRAVEAFQTQYAEEILAPWGLSAPTGFVYLTTKWHLNNLSCGLDLPMPSPLIPESEV